MDDDNFLKNRDDIPQPLLQIPDPKPNSSSRYCFEACLSSIFGVLFAVFFGIYTSNPSYYNGQHCQGTLLLWSRYIFYYSTVSVINYIIITPLIKCSVSQTPQGLSQAASGQWIFSGLIGLGGLVGFIGICVAYGEEGDCGDLRKLALGYIIVLSICFGLICLAFCCICGMALVLGGAMVKSMRFGEVQLGVHKKQDILMV